MNTKRTLVTLISASLLTVTAVPFALADGPDSDSGQTTDRVTNPTTKTTDQKAYPAPERQTAQVTDHTTQPMYDPNEPESDLEQASDKATGAVSDTWVQGKLEAALIADDNLSAFAIDTQVKNGVATLKGTVEAKADIDRATKLAMSIKGITKVNNSLVVESQAAKSTARAAGDATDPMNTSKTAPMAKPDMNHADMNDSDMDHSGMERTADNATDAVSDTWVQGKLEASFMADDNLSSFAIDTEVKDGVATLTGTVETQADIDRATKVAKSIKGITKVNNQLVVEPANTSK